jgi:uncharacterized protein YndB with AHSA1/START domain
VEDGSVRRELTIAATPDEVWRALVDPASLSAWFGAIAELEPRRGGPVRFRFPEGTERRGIVEAAEPGRRLAFRWRRVDAGAFAAGPSVVCFELAAEGDGTRLVVTESPGILAEAAS